MTITKTAQRNKYAYKFAVLYIPILKTETQVHIPNIHQYSNILRIVVFKTTSNKGISTVSCMGVGGEGGR